METMAYLVIPSLSVKDFNAESNQYVAGIPAMTGFTGFGHGVERYLQSIGWALQVDGVAVLMHELGLHSGHPKCPAAMQGAKDFINPPIIEEIKGDMRVSLVLRLVGDGEDDDLLQRVEAEFATKETRKSLYDWIYAHPCCGGSCHDMGGWLQTLVATQKTDDDKLEKALRRLHQRDKGYFVLLRDDLLEAARAQGQDALDGLLDALRVYRKDGKDGSWQRNQEGWVVPLAVGYQAIETPQIRSGARKGAPHVYAEPLTTLGELVYAGWLWKPDFMLEKIFWMHRHRAATHTYYVTTLSGDE